MVRAKRKKKEWVMLFFCLKREGRSKDTGWIILVIAGKTDVILLWDGKSISAPGKSETETISRSARGEEAWRLRLLLGRREWVHRRGPKVGQSPSRALSEC